MSSNQDTTTAQAQPLEGLAALKTYWSKDLQAGFMVFLLALPLSLGIAKASGFPAAMGLLTAMIGGFVGLFFRVAPLSVKGPAAGLITICAAAIADLGGETQGWPLACAAILVMGVLQMGLAWLKLGKLSAFFPHTAVQGMLAAIGLIIILKQLPVLLGDAPMLYQGQAPLELLLEIPDFIAQADWAIGFIGLSGLFLMFILPIQPIAWLRKLPAPMIVLAFTISLAAYEDFKHTEPAYALVSIGDFWGSLAWRPDFSAMGQLVFWKYVMMFLFVNSLESLLTVKAVDQLDSSPRKADPDADLMATGAGNSLSAMLGGLPLISEVLRSSANIRYGARSKWANVFHGLFLLLAMALIIPWLEWIPNAALAAMLIYAGYNLASPKVFKHVAQLGKDQLAVFLVTVFVTLAEDLLLGIFAGLLLELIFHLFRGSALRDLFRARYQMQGDAQEQRIEVEGMAGFTNLLSYKKLVAQLPEKAQIVWDFSRAKVVDHSFLDYLYYVQSEYNNRGGQMSLAGLESLNPQSAHKLATRVRA